MQIMVTRWQSKGIKEQEREEEWSWRSHRGHGMH